MSFKYKKISEDELLSLKIKKCFVRVDYENKSIIDFIEYLQPYLNSIENCKLYTNPNQIVYFHNIMTISRTFEIFQDNDDYLYISFVIILDRHKLTRLESNIFCYRIDCADNLVNFIKPLIENDDIALKFIYNNFVENEIWTENK